MADPIVSEDTPKLIKSRLDAQEKQRIQQQGLGKSIISAEMNGIRFIAVGNQVYHSARWKTFPDFLFSYLGMILGKRLGDADLAKPLAERHPMSQWHHHVCEYQRKRIKTRGQLTSLDATGAVSAYLDLAYNLYLLAHNEKIHSRLLKRLANKDQFQGALFETYVAALLIKAGCELEFENETDGSQTHCEFTAKFPSGNRYSVEAKSRASGKPAAQIGKQLRNALEKKASWPRLVFIDVNVPDTCMKDDERSGWMDEAVATLRERETNLTIEGVAAPPAYVFLTNHPHMYYAEAAGYRCAILAEGFKIPDFKDDARFPSIRAVLASREKHADMFSLLKSMKAHGSIPSTFDGEIPAFAFGNAANRLLVGEKYLLPDENGEKVGELLEVLPLDKAGTSYCVFKTEDGRNVLYTCPLTPEELAAYRKFPDTCFGVDRPVSKKIDDPVELFDWFHNSYKNTSREKLLEFLKGAKDFDQLVNLDQKELVITYCERLVHSILNSSRMSVA